MLFLVFSSLKLKEQLQLTQLHNNICRQKRWLGMFLGLGFSLAETTEFYFK